MLTVSVMMGKINLKGGSKTLKKEVFIPSMKGDSVAEMLYMIISLLASVTSGL